MANHSACEREARRLSYEYVIRMQNVLGYDNKFIPDELSVKESNVKYGPSSYEEDGVFPDRLSTFAFRFAGGICTKVHMRGVDNYPFSQMSWEAEEIIVYLTPTSCHGGPYAWWIKDPRHDREFGFSNSLK